MSKSKEPKPVSEFTEEQREWFRINKKYERKLQPFIGKSLLPDSPEYEKCKSIMQERELEFLKFNEKHCKPEPIDTPDKLSKWIDQELVTLRMIKMGNSGEFPSDRAKDSYLKALDDARALCENSRDLLPSLPDILPDSLMGLQSIRNWCVDARNQEEPKPGADLGKLKPTERITSMIMVKSSKENWKAIKNEYDISKNDFGKKINFVSDPFKRQVIFRDVEHAFVLASQGFSKPAIILAGGVIEELLRLYLDHKNIKVTSDRFVDYIKTCEDKGLLKRGVSRLTDSIRDFRNLVHLENEETKGHTLSKATAKGAVSSIFTIANDFR